MAYGEAGVALFGKEQVPAGAAWTTEDGAQIPTVLTYTDENGEDHYFISAETAAEVLDMVYGAVYLALLAVRLPPIRRWIVRTRQGRTTATAVQPPAVQSAERTSPSSRPGTSM